MEYMIDKEAGKFETRQVTIVDAINNIMEQVNMMFMARFNHPVSITAYCLFGKLLDFEPSSPIVK